MTKRRISRNVLKENYAEILEDILIAVVIGLAWIGLSSLVGANLTGGDWLGDVAPFFIGLTSVYVAFSVLSVSLEENRKQARLDRELAVRPMVYLESVPKVGSYPDEIYVRFSIANVDGRYVDEFGALPRMHSNVSKFGAENTGLGPAFNVRLVVSIGGQLFISKGEVNRLEVGSRPVFRVAYSDETKNADSLFLTFSDLYNNQLVVALIFDVRDDQLVIVANSFLDLSDSKVAREVAELAKRDQTFVDTTLPRYQDG